MWKDGNNSLFTIYTDFDRQTDFPTLCPVCNRKEAHIYMDVHNEITRRGGLWIWCSYCQEFIHCSTYVPVFWSSSALIKKEELCAVPEYLEQVKNEVDNHAKRMRIRKIQVENQ